MKFFERYKPVIIAFVIISTILAGVTAGVLLGRNADSNPSNVALVQISEKSSI